MVQNYIDLVLTDYLLQDEHIVDVFLTCLVNTKIPGYVSLIVAHVAAIRGFQRLSFRAC